MARQLNGEEVRVHGAQADELRGAQALLPLAQAIDEERTADIPKLTDSFIAAEHGGSLPGIVREHADRDHSTAVHARARGGEQEAARTTIARARRRSSFLNEDPGKARRDIAVYKATAERAISGADASSVEKSKHSVEVMVRVLDMLRDAILAVDQDLLRMEESDAWRRTLDPYMTRHAYWNALIDVLATLVGGIEDAAAEADGSALRWISAKGVGGRHSPRPARARGEQAAAGDHVGGRQEGHRRHNALDHADGDQSRTRLRP
jgi:hypothetical protein